MRSAALLAEFAKSCVRHCLCRLPEAHVLTLSLYRIFEFGDGEDVLVVEDEAVGSVDAVGKRKRDKGKENGEEDEDGDVASPSLKRQRVKPAIGGEEGGRKGGRREGKGGERRKKEQERGGGRERERGERAQKKGKV